MGRSNASIRRVQKTQRGVGDGYHRRSAGLTGGQRIRGDEFARFRLETELSEESRIERARGRIPARTRRGRPGTLTPQWWRERRCGRAKGRSEFPAPAGCRPSRTYFAALTQRAAKSARWRAADNEPGAFPPQIERRACRRFAQSCREPWTLFIAANRFRRSLFP